MTREHQTSADATEPGLPGDAEAAGAAVAILPGDVRPTPLPDPLQFSPYLAKLAKQAGPA